MAEIISTRADPPGAASYWVFSLQPGPPAGLVFVSGQGPFPTQRPGPSWARRSRSRPGRCSATATRS